VTNSFVNDDLLNSSSVLNDTCFTPLYLPVPLQIYHQPRISTGPKPAISVGGRTGSAHDPPVRCVELGTSRRLGVVCDCRTNDFSRGRKSKLKKTARVPRGSANGCFSFRRPSSFSFRRSSLRVAQHPTRGRLLRYSGIEGCQLPTAEAVGLSADSRVSRPSQEATTPLAF